jgi:hypothetical protein
MKWLFIPIVKIVYSTYAHGAKQYGEKCAGERQMSFYLTHPFIPSRRGETKEGAGGVFLFDLFSIISFNLLHVFYRHLY